MSGCSSSSIVDEEKNLETGFCNEGYLFVDNIC
jgi:hypothetical protein